ncbi:MAG: site-specific integrase, partial [Pseudomonadota bacterium]|nr:site-specific integrase [Pseudomonadota bacterium]
MDSPAARAKLKASGKPYWRAIDTGLHLGYRKGLNGGRWVCRRYLGAGQYEVATVAIADDHSPADGASILDFFQAQRRAREVATQTKAPEKNAFTVAAALAVYFERLAHEGSRSMADAQRRARFHILPGLGAILVADLTRDTISKWLTGMAGKANDGHSGQDAIRANRASANRVLTILRAALNQAFRDGNAETDVPWRTVKPFHGVDAPRLRYFTKDEVTRLLNAAQDAFRDLVKAALFTGCRYGELGRLRASDFNPDSGTIFIGQSKSGKARHVVLADEGRRFFATLTAGRPGDALLLIHADGSAWGPSHQIRWMALACEAARITPPAGFHILRHTHASHLVMNGCALNVVAHNLGHADTRMTERHYAHLAPSYVAETIRKFAPEYGTGKATKIV